MNAAYYINYSYTRMRNRTRRPGPPHQQPQNLSPERIPHVDQIFGRTTRCASGGVRAVYVTLW
jgi:hypothetical protein